MRATRNRRRTACALLAPIALLLAGCRLDVVRTREEPPVDPDLYESLREGETRLPEAVETLGPPDRIKWESGKDRLNWDELDELYAGIRFQLPFSFFGYQQDLFQYFASRQETNTVELLFDEEGVLEQKTRRVPEAEAREPSLPWRLHLTPVVERSLYLVGDGGFDRYRDLFHDGNGIGFDIGVQPVAPLTLVAGGLWRRFSGRGVDITGGRRASLGDLDLWSAEVKARLQIPLSALAGAQALEELWSALIANDPSLHDGWLIFAEAGFGATGNSNVAARIDGARDGDLYSASWGLSSTASAGLEYSFDRVSLRAGITFRGVDSFDEGDSTLDGSGSGLQTWGVSASLSVKF